MKIGDLVRYRKDLEPHLRKRHVNRPALVIEVTPSHRATRRATALVLTSKGLIRRRYQFELEIINENR